MPLESFLTACTYPYDVQVRNRTIYLLNEPVWEYIGAFVDETVYALTGHRWRNYISLTGMYQMENEHPDPRNHFHISVEQIRDTPQSPDDNGRLIGISHRHPIDQPLPSDNDYAGIDRTLVGIVWTELGAVWYDRKGILNTLVVPL